jgi:hypothetical protein
MILLIFWMPERQINKKLVAQHWSREEDETKLEEMEKRILTLKIQSWEGKESKNTIS